MIFKTLLLLTSLVALLFWGAEAFLKIHSRNEWGARVAKYKVPLDNNLDYVIIHETGGYKCRATHQCNEELKKIQRHHMKDLDYADIGYNFIICGTSGISEGRGWNIVGKHTDNWNDRSIGIAFTGNYTADTVESGQMFSLTRLLELALFKGKLNPDYVLYSSRQITDCSDCPENNLWEEIKKLPHWGGDIFPSAEIWQSNNARA